MTPKQMAAGVKACEAMTNGIPKLIAVFDDQIAGLALGKDKVVTNIRATREQGVDEHTDARLAGYEETMEAFVGHMTLVSRSLKTISKGQLALAKYLGQLLQPISLTVVAEPIMDEGPAPLPLDSVPPGSEFPFQGEGDQ